MEIKKKLHDPKHIDFESIAESKKFKELISTKKKFIISCTIFFLVFYFALPVLTSYSKILNTKAIGEISWAWIFALLQFIMTWVLCTIYVKKAASFDKLAEEVISENISEGEVGA
ncbi:DUF485 domain-containing protein [Bacillus sp. FJAT-49736]|uniref:DUF485 domain-containing protein n=1 Tax=Bacillus sp. FJAT-49736 TaxID=2833582 RepID=UPI001BC99522|nr:DUF485 domain-containing protein [Bacillus sp. FJAT-49736]MBS4172646.1 DUF485 domain-containing protein [Bacillus sp. FJAT-49736]